MSSDKVRIITLAMYAERLGIPQQNMQRAYRHYANPNRDDPPWMRRIARVIATPNLLLGNSPLWLSTEIEEFEKTNPPQELMRQEFREWRQGTNERFFLLDEKELDEAAKAALNDRQYEVFSHRYMLDGRPFKTRKVLAGELGVSVQRVGSIQARAETKVFAAMEGGTFRITGGFRNDHPVE